MVWPAVSLSPLRTRRPSTRTPPAASKRRAPATPSAGNASASAWSTRCPAASGGTRVCANVRLRRCYFFLPPALSAPALLPSDFATFWAAAGGLLLGRRRRRPPAPACASRTLRAARASAAVRSGRFLPGVRPSEVSRCTPAGRRIHDDAIAFVQLGVVREPVDAREITRRQPVPAAQLRQRVAGLRRVEQALLSPARGLELQELLGAEAHRSHLRGIQQHHARAIEVLAHEDLHHHARLQLGARIQVIPLRQLLALDAERVGDLGQPVALARA